MILKLLAVVIVGFVVFIFNIEEVIAENFVVTIPSGTGKPGCEETNDCFQPGSISIAQGDKVTWNNLDSVAHTVTSGNAVDGPDGNFDSKLIIARGTFSVNFINEGKFDYFCMVHPWMVGEIKVNPPSSCTFDKSPPGIPILLSPKNGETTSDTTPTFDWTDVSDDCGPITYTLQYNWEIGFDDKDSLGSINDLSTSSFTNPNPWSDHTKYWRVVAIDSAGNRAYSDIYKLSILSESNPDTDGDGIIDSKDSCINQKETFNGYQDTDGCPDTKPTVPIHNDTSGEIDGPNRIENYLYFIIGGVLAAIVVIGVIFAKKRKTDKPADFQLRDSK